ncbi:MAG: hypothetical protein JEZ00_21330 [Anaerolineaceae bacterium]|nr:hypothetical protein [Anaerolineaceae bacterium]
MIEQSYLLKCALYGAYAALIIRFIILIVKKVPRRAWRQNLLKAGISGALLGMAGGYAGYLVSTWVSGFSQHWLILLLSAIIAAFIVGGILMNILERLVWSRLGWG